jgi:Lamin Tail Domain
MKKIVILVLSVIFIFAACDDDAGKKTNNTNSSVCNNGILEQNEICDGTQLNSQACYTLEMGYTGGTLSCSKSCVFDTSLCEASHPSCGDGIIDGLEVCDGTEFNGATCASLNKGFIGGILACNNCAYEVSKCNVPDICGDGECNGIETPETCAVDCETIDPFCGDGICNGSETLTTCATDCTAPYCGDGICNGSETLTTCATDCTAPYCGDGICNGDETVTTCATDCTAPYCGDGTCNGDETVTTCATDCGPAPYCGDGTCNGDETQTNCATDCGTAPYCGDGTCNGSEDATTCYNDCASCGDGTCDNIENSTFCYADCGSCGDNSCDGTETPANCLVDCDVVCGDNSCDGTEHYTNCVADCPLPDPKGLYEQFNGVDYQDLEGYKITFTPAGDIYTYTTSAATEFFIIENTSASPVTFIQEDQDATEFLLNFDFPFYGNSYNSIWIDSNGFIKFESGFNDYCLDITELFGTDKIMLGWTDLRDISPGDLIYVDQDFDNSSNREFVAITYHAREYFTPNHEMYAQLVLFDDGEIEMNYSMMELKESGTTPVKTTYVGIVHPGLTTNYPTETDFILTYPVCGDNICDGTELFNNCPADCNPVCGNGSCEGSENIDNCYDDCGECGNNICTRPGENFTTCATDCLTEEDPVGIFEEFSDSDTDIDNKRITFTPNGGTYDYAVTESSDFYITPNTGTTTSTYIMGDDISYDIPLNFNFPFFDKVFTKAYVSTNGYIRFNYPTTDSFPSNSSFFEQYTIALWFDSIEAIAGDTTLYVDEGVNGGVNYWAFTYHAAETTNSSDILYAQIILFSDGKIILDYPNAMNHLENGGAGISKPGDTSNYPPEVNYVKLIPSNEGEVIFTEIQYNPEVPLDDWSGEYLEIYNNSPTLLYLDGCVLEDSFGNSMVFPDDTILGSNDYLVVIGSILVSENGGIPMGVLLGNVSLENASNTISITCDSSLIDSVHYDDDYTAGYSIQLDSRFYDATLNDASDYWCETDVTQMYSATNYGTPGADNHLCTTIPFTTVFSEDFEAIPLTTITDWLNDNYTWTYSSTRLTCTGCSGTWAEADSDAAPNDIDMNEILELPGMDLSSYTMAFLTFSHHYRHLTNTEGLIEISVNGGTIWTPIVSYTSEININESLNISTFTGAGMTDVRIRFRYVDNDTWAWYWLIDNIKVETM